MKITCLKINNTGLAWVSFFFVVIIIFFNWWKKMRIRTADCKMEAGLVNYRWFRNS